jgi:outer membrane protein OmpA-like peptidoglycan-associated protein
LSQYIAGNFESCRVEPSSARKPASSDAAKQILFANAKRRRNAESLSSAARLPSSVCFAFNSDELRPNAVNILAECAELIQRDHAKHVRVIGHTDSVGRTDYNLELSKRRALSVRTWLVKEGGIVNEDVLAIGLGEKKPMASNDTADGRAKNRRVEVMMPMNEARQQPPPNKKLRPLIRTASATLINVEFMLSSPHLYEPATYFKNGVS